MILLGLLRVRLKAAINIPSGEEFNSTHVKETGIAP
jgi:hypothetical protein